MKTDIFNLIILDESGSMSSVTKQTISGCNETINTIKASKEKFKDSQNHYVSIFAFQSDGNKPSRYLIKNELVENVKHITSKDYCPDGCTPLYDAIGSTLVDLKAIVKEKELAIGSVTIITDGMENSSHHYTRKKVASMIDALKELGWNFNFIGANIDVDEVADALSIENRLAFNNDEEGTEEMFRRHSEGKVRYLNRLFNLNLDTYSQPKSEEERKELQKKLRDAEKGYFID